LTNRRGWQTRNVQAEFRDWSQRLTHWGWEISPDELETRLWKGSSAFGTVRDRVAWPFARYADATGARQGWQMFATPQEYPAELHLDVRVDGTWHALVRPRDPRSTWRRRQREHNRMRKLLGRFARTFYPERYEAFARWLATEAANDFPQASQVRARLWRYRSLRPERVLAGEQPEGHYEHELVFDAEALR
jgi:hypothetical protein